MKKRMNISKQKMIKLLHFSDSEDSDFDDVPTAPAFQQKPTTVNHMSMPSFLDSAAPRKPEKPQQQSMPSFLDSTAPSPPAPRKPEKPLINQRQQPAHQSMPQFLNDDLQLSDDSTDDDSD